MKFTTVCDSRYGVLDIQHNTLITVRTLSIKVLPRLLTDVVAATKEPVIRSKPSERVSSVGYSEHIVNRLVGRWQHQRQSRFKSRKNWGARRQQSHSSTGRTPLRCTSRGIFYIRRVLPGPSSDWVQQHRVSSLLSSQNHLPYREQQVPAQEDVRWPWLRRKWWLHEHHHDGFGSNLLVREDWQMPYSSGQDRVCHPNKRGQEIVWAIIIDSQGHPGHAREAMRKK